MEERNLRKTRQGVVTSNKMDKTVVVAARFKSIFSNKNTLISHRTLTIVC